MHLTLSGALWAIHLVTSNLPSVSASPGQFSKPQRKCPQSCSAAETISDWTTYHNHRHLHHCSNTTLLSFNIFNSLGDPATHQSIRVCSADGVETTDAPSCPGFNGVTFTSQMDSVQQSSAIVNDVESAVSAAEQLMYYLSSSEAACGTTSIFGYSNKTAVGIFVGGFISAPGMASTILSDFITSLKSGGDPIVQLCDDGIAGSDFTIGVVASDDPDLAIVQQTVAAWASGRCVSGTSRPWESVSVPVLALPGGGSLANSTTGLYTNSTANLNRRSRRHLAARDDCTTATVVSGDSCSSLATECGITATEFTEYNTASDLCSSLEVGQLVCCSSGTLPTAQANADGTCTAIEVESGDSCGTLATECDITASEFSEYNNATDLCSSLAVGQHVCCTPGNLPDYAPQMNDDGSCYSYTVLSGDSCSALATEYSLTVDKINGFNNDTWGFMGCDDLQIGQVICLSDGEPPFPASISNAECGPQVPGTIAVENTRNISWMNPCPLNVCCDMWGQCGSQPDYCTASSASSGAPGTAAPGENGCISNCGLDIVSGPEVSDQYTVGYYEAFAVDRDCLVLDALDIPVDNYTHVHFAYANITSDFQISIAGAVAAQWDDFYTMSGIKHILSFGGWAFSTDADTYTIFRNMVLEENRQTMIDSLVKFASNYDIDGYDFDWEYPGEPDIPGIPAGDSDEGDNYVAFLTELRAALDDDISISIAAPASYWYLQSFPIANISKVVDYIVYMTYDLHGQWDYGNAYSDQGCADGNCLRSHVNSTETMWSLAMVTKAGVSVDKIVVGVASYGRSFGMTDSTCTGPECTYEGPDSTAVAGQCTQTSGYISNAEINALAGNTTNGSIASLSYDSASSSNIMIYENTWAAYMDSTEMESRKANYSTYGFLGTSEWAIDLERFSGDIDTADEIWNCPDADLFTDLDSIEGNSSVPSDCYNYYILSVMAANLTASLDLYNSIMSDGYEEKFGYYAEAVKSIAPSSWTSFYDNEYDSLTTCTWLGPLDGNEDSTDYVNQTGGCPPNDKPSFVTDNANVGFGLYTTIENATEFESTAADNYGIDPTWIDYDAYTLAQQYCTSPTIILPGGGVAPPQPCPTGTVPAWYEPALYSDLSVDDPSSIISGSLPNFQNISTWLNEVVAEMGSGYFPANDADAVDSFSMTVYTVDAAIAQMQQVAEIGEEVEEAEKKAKEEGLILAFVSALLLLLPGLGEGLDAILDTTILARMAVLIGDVGDAAMTLYTVYEDPSSAPLAITGYLIGGFLARDEAVFAKAASARRSMAASEVAALGAKAEGNVKKIESIKQLCRL